MKATPFLMFQGRAGQALALYREAFPDLDVLRLDENGDGTIAMARIHLGGQDWLLNDSPPVHDFDFTPSTSIFIDCDSEEQLHRLADVLGEGGQVMMERGAYGFSTLFTWIADRFGVSWQLNLP